MASASARSTKSGEGGSLDEGTLEGTAENGCTRCESDDIVEYLQPLTNL